MERPTTLTTAFTEAYADNAAWYWEALSAANQHAVDYMRSMTEMAWRSNPMTLIAPILEQGGRRMTETLRDMQREENEMQQRAAEEEQHASPRHSNGAASHNGKSGRKTAARGRGRHR